MYTISSPGRDFLSENFLGIAIMVMRQSVVRSPGAISKRTGKSLWPNLATCSSLSSSNLPRPLLASLLFLVPRAIPTSSLLIQWVAHDDVLHLRFRRSHSILRGKRLATSLLYQQHPQSRRPHRRVFLILARGRITAWFGSLPGPCFRP